MNILTTIEQANQVFHVSLSPTELREARESLSALLRQNEVSHNMYAQNVALSEVLIYKIRIKELLLKYVDCKEFDLKASKDLENYVNEAMTDIVRKDYKKTKKLYEEVLSFMQIITPIVEKLKGIFASVEDNNGVIVLQDAEAFDKTISEIREVRVQALSVRDLDKELFTSKDNVGVLKLPDVKGILLTAIEEEIENYSQEKEKIQKAIPLKILEEKFKDFKTIYNESLEVFPQIDLRRNNVGNCFILYTPFEEEAYLYVKSVADSEKLDFLVADANAFSPKEASQLIDVCNILVNRKKHLVIRHAENLSVNSSACEDLLKALMIFGQRGGTSFIINNGGERKLYERAYEMTKNSNVVRARDIGDLYLTMPPYSGVVDLLEEINLITTDDHEAVKKNLPFIGFAGLNHILKRIRNKDELWKYGKERSQYCQRVANAYLTRIVSQMQLIDSAWGDFSSSVRKDEIKKEEIDYDQITLVNANNLRKIVNSSHSLFAKCGAIAMYCLTAGEDKTEWQRLPLEIKSARIELATKLVYKVLNISIEPDVEVIADKDWTHKGAGGLCIGGGTQIVYKEECVAGYEWTIKAICHECYHSLQAQVERRGWNKELFVELGITAGRIEQWIYNHQGYVDIAKNKHNYMIQVVESDARAFELDCFNHGCQVLGTLDLE